MRVRRTRQEQHASRFVKGLAVITMALFLLTGCGNSITGDSYQRDNRNTAQNSAATQTETAGNKPVDAAQTQRITLEEARQIALNHAGVSSVDAVFENREFDLDDGTPVYELEFRANGIEYEYDVHAETGEILKAEQDRDDNRYGNR